MKLWLGNLNPEVSDEELTDFIHRYGCPDPSDIQHVDGDGSRPAVILTFDGPVDEQVSAAQLRMHDVYWKERRLVAQTLMHFGGPA